MPDYASILRRSISGLADPSPEMREAVYQRARAALARQLTAVDPPLSTREIESQHQELEDAVARLEAEFAPATPVAPASTGFSDLSGRGDDFFSTMPEPQPAPPPPGPKARGGLETAPPQPPPGRGGFEDDDEPFEDDEERGSRLPLLIGLVAVLLVVIGGGAYLYAARDSLFGSGSSNGELAASAPAAPSEPVSMAAADSTEPPKRDDRLTNGAEAPPAAAAPAPATVPQAASSGAEATSSDGLPLEDLASLQNNPPDSGTSLVEQRAIYYFQGSEGQAGQANEGTATWTEITKDNHPAIQATLKIPERGVTVTVTIYKNYDPALPASHLVEVQFIGNLADSPVQRVPALVLKQTEQARGQPLAGAAVPVTNELFWIALSSEEEDVSRNIQLLREGSWFDIPILFSDQTRALITFEKGIPGDKVFETVMASWTPS